MPTTAPIPPFWSRLREISLYPFRGTALASLVTYSLLSPLTFLPGLGGRILALIIWIAIWRYCFEILAHTANGHMEAPEFASHTDTGAVLRFIALGLIWLLAIVLAARYGGRVAATFAVLLFGLLLPGAVMSLAIDGNLPQALNPLTPLAIMRRIGPPYLAGVALLLVVEETSTTMQYLLERYLPLPIAAILGTTASIWALFVAFHLYGYMVFRNHEALGFEPAAPEGRKPLRTRDTDLVEQTESQVAEGDAEAALARIRAEMDERAVPLATHVLYRRLLRGRDDKAELVRHAHPYLSLLLFEKKEREALALVNETLALDPDFSPGQPEDGQRLAERASRLGQSELAIRLWLGMLEHWPRDPARPQWALAVVPLLARRDRVEEARAVLKQVAGEATSAGYGEQLAAALAELPKA